MSRTILAISLLAVFSAMSEADCQYTYGQMDVSPTRLDFGSVNVGQRASKTITVKNPDPSYDTAVTGASSSKSEFQIKGKVQACLEAKQSIQVTVDFAPGSAGNVSGSIKITGDGIKSYSFTVDVSGNGISSNPDIDLSSNRVDFGQFDVGTFKEQNVTISNKGEAGSVLVINSVTASMPGLKILPAPPIQIDSGKSIPVKILFTMPAVGVQNVILTLRSNDQDEPSQNISVTGTGVEGPWGFVDQSNRSRVAKNTVQTSGVQWIDFNGDDRQDLYMTGHAGNAAFQNVGSGRFNNVTKRSKLGNSGLDSRGASWSDADNDGDLDVFIANANAPSPVLRNNNGVFSQVGASPERMNPSATRADNAQGGIWLDFNRDGLVDLYIVRDNSANQLLKNGGIFRFTDVGASAKVNDNGPGRSAISADFNNDGYPDIYLVNFNRPNKLFLNNQNETFRDASSSSGIRFSGASVQVTAADYDADGDIDIFVVNSNGPSLLYRNNNGKFQNVAGAAGLAGPKKGRSASFNDFDRDGDQDLLFVQSDGGNLLFRNDAGKFTRISNIDMNNSDDPGSVSDGDYDNDGLPDIIVGDEGQGTGNDSVYQNTGGGAHHWLMLTLQGTQSNRSAIGAKVIVRVGVLVQAKIVSSGNGQNQESLPLEFGLGNATSAGQVLIAWPSGTLQTLENVPADQRLKIVEPFP